MANYAQNFVFDHGKDDVDREKNKFKYKLMRIVALLILILFMFGQALEQAAKSTFNTIMLNLFGEELVLSETEQIAFDVESFLDGSKVAVDSYDKSAIRYCAYDNNLALYEDTGFALQEVEEVQFDKIYVNIYSDTQTILLSSTAKYDSCEYAVEAIFGIKDYTPEEVELTFGQGTKASSVYEYSEGKKAYFIRDWGFGTYRVYFEANDVLYEMTIPSTKEDVENAEKIVELMAR